MSNTAIPVPDAPESGHHERPADHAPGFLTRVLERIGLAREPDIRDVIEDALEKEEEASDDSIGPQERAMMQNLLRFGAVRVEDVMVPRADIVAVDEDASLSELLCVFSEAGHSRVPVYRDTLDDPRGMVHIKDLMAWITERARKAREERSKARGKQPKKAANGGAAAHRPLRLGAVDLAKPVASAGILRDVLFVPPSMSAMDLLLRMQATRIHLALVVDEYGGTDGLVSIEDLVEEIVGEIEDEHDSNGGPLIREEDGDLIADARTPIAFLEERTGLDLLPPDREEDADTLGGLVFALAGRVPVRGELVRHESGLEFEVLEADPRRIKKLKIHARGTASRRERR
ncbi:MAG: HlyC/CorC family transporter, partial [Alphaproteobacteria bacterium]